MANVKFSFGKSEVLFDGLDLQIRRHELCGILGAIGSGKSTLIKLMAGLLEREAGEVLILGKSWEQWQSSRQEIYRTVTMTFQKGGLFDSLTVSENLALPLKELLGISDAEAARPIREALDAVGLSGTEQKAVTELSGGMQKRLALARALILKPKVLFLDEPTAGLDPVTSREIIDLIVRVHQEQQMTTVFVTSDPGYIFQIADRVLFLSDGKILLEGIPEILRTHTNAVWKRFLTGKRAS